MAETLVKNPTCSKCGEDARPQALFCFACGGEIIGLPEDEKGNVSSAWFKEDIVDIPDGKKEMSAAAAGMQKSESDERPVDDNDSSSGAGMVAEEEDREVIEDEGREVETEDEDDEEIDHREKAEVDEPADEPLRVRRKYVADRPSVEKVKLKTAADLRNRPKSIRAKRVELVWEEKTGSPNVLFLVVGLLIATVAGVLFFLAYILK